MGGNAVTQFATVGDCAPGEPIGAELWLVAQSFAEKVDLLLWFDALLEVAVTRDADYEREVGRNVVGSVLWEDSGDSGTEWLIGVGGDETGTG